MFGTAVHRLTPEQLPPATPLPTQAPTPRKAASVSSRSASTAQARTSRHAPTRRWTLRRNDARYLFPRTHERGRHDRDDWANKLRHAGST